MFDEDYEYGHSTTLTETPYTGTGVVIEVWCERVDEVKPIIGHKYIRNCPMCGDEIEDVPDRWGDD